MTLASQRNEPFSMSPSETPSASDRLAQARGKPRPRSGERRSGSLTISISGVPQRLKSTRAVRAGQRPRPALVDGLGRVLLEMHALEADDVVAVGRRHGQLEPPLQSGSSNWLI